MGFFDRLFGPKADPIFEDKYARMKECAKKVGSFIFWDASCVPRAKEYTDAYLEFERLAEEVGAEAFNKKFVKECEEMGGTYPRHPSFGVILFDKKQDSLGKAREGLKSTYLHIQSFVARKEAFDKKYSGLQEYEITLSNEKVLRNLLLEMPEIKYANITKSFNKYKLNSFVVVDTETTGLKATSDRIVQLSAVRYVAWEPTEIFNCYINPKKPIPSEASKIHGITGEMVADKPTIKQVAKSFMNFVGNSDVVGYNLPFDMGFLYAEGIDLITAYKKRKYYDVLALARKVYKKDLDYFKLTDVALHQGVIYDAHNSLNDCFATGEVFCNLVDDITGE